METFDLTPDPQILVALTHTPLRPIDALCELIDNAIDSFRAARLQGNPVQAPLIIVDLPKPSELAHNQGVLRIWDNGSGLDAEMAENALRAGFSGNNPYDSLGLFGMGFNISTGKLGRLTKFTTTRAGESQVIEAQVDLDSMLGTRSYAVPVQRKDKPKGFEQGTVVEVCKWWPQGNPVLLQMELDKSLL